MNSNTSIPFTNNGLVAQVPTGAMESKHAQLLILVVLKLPGTLQVKREVASRYGLSSYSSDSPLAAGSADGWLEAKVTLDKLSFSDLPLLSHGNLSSGGSSEFGPLKVLLVLLLVLLVTTLLLVKPLLKDWPISLTTTGPSCG